MSASILSPVASGASALPDAMNSIAMKAKANNEAATSSASSTAASSSSGSSQTSLSSLGTTFLKLLTQELQNQDPTSPMDSTQMVGQMISLNQLDQIASINQLLSNYFSPTTGSSTTGTTKIS